MKVFSVMPHLTDPDFIVKKEILFDVARGCNCLIVIGANSGEEGDIIKSLEMLKSSDAVLVDLTLERPSCYFELGYAQAIEKPVILIAQTGTQIHQVISRSSLRTFSNLVEYESLIRKALISLAG